ncbi:MAG: aconitase family protein [Rhodopseudomonas palustris]|nr:aconitase family protein [Rhodopseudomonas palustris]
MLIGAGLLARKAARQGSARRKPWVKTSLAPGSQVVAEYLANSGLQADLDRGRLQSGRLRLHHLHRQFRPAAGADLASRSTTTAWSPPRCCRATATSKGASSPDVQANYLASPPLVVAYALAGTVDHGSRQRSRSAPAATASRSI